MDLWYTYSVILCNKGGAEFHMFYAKLALVLLLCIPIAILGFFLFERLLNQALDQAKKEKEIRMERQRIEIAKKKSGQMSGRSYRR